MNSKQQAETGMFKRLRTKVDTTDPLIIAAMLHFSGAYTGFLNCQSQISDCFDAQIEDRTGWSQSKKIIRNTLTQNILDYGAITESYAAFINDNVLLNKVNFTPSELEAYTEQEFIAICNVMATILTTHQTDLLPYGLTALMVTDFVALKTSYVTITPLPKTGIDERKIATNEIKALISQAFSFLQTMDRAVRAYRLTNPSFYNEYFVAREIEDPQTRNLAAKGTIVDPDGVAIPFVKLTSSTLDIKRKLSEKGNFYISGEIQGPHLLTFTQPNFRKIVKEVIFVRGQRLQIEIVMYPL